MYLQVKAGKTSKRIAIFIPDASAGDGSGLTGLLFNTSGLTAYYAREDDGNAGATSITLATATKGTWATGGFIEKDATNQPGVYEFGIPNALIATGAGWVTIIFKGAANMVPVLIELELVGPNIYSPLALTKNQAISGFTFQMVDTAGAPVTGLTVAATRNIDGGAFASCANSVTEIANGFYKIDLAAADLNGIVIALRFHATGAVDNSSTLIMQPS